MHITDIKNMPRFNPVVKNGIESVSAKKVIWTKHWYAILHGAMLCLTPDRRLWRCPACNEGCYVKSWNKESDELDASEARPSIQES